MRTTAVPEASASAAETVAAFLTAATASSTPGPVAGEAIMKSATRAVAAATDTAPTDARTYRRRGEGRCGVLVGTFALVGAIRARTA
jgi:hypothetical protein